MQQDLNVAINFFEKAAQQSSILYFAFDLTSNKFLYLSNAFEKIWKMKPIIITDNPYTILDTIHQDDIDYLTKHFHELIMGKKKQDIEFRIDMPETKAWITLKPILISQEENGKAIIVGTAEDISKKKQAEMHMANFAAKKDSVLEILSHDLAAPFNNIKGLSSILMKKAQDEDLPDFERIIKMIESTSERSIRLIREFVKHEFLHSKDAALKKDRVDIVKKMKLIIDQYKESEEEIAKQFNFVSSADHILIAIDVYKFSQVINNLISNAIKFTEDHGEITLTIEDKKDQVIISVADNGIGIPAKYHDTLFERFNRARRPGLKGEPSVGLGMSIIKTIVEWHDGKIWFESEVDKGSTFYIALPKQ